jgi:uroporphyrin-III C-methyltransferase
VPQEAINELLVTEGRRSATVVRLKGGDPYVFGRGGEEAAALRAAGIPCEVVPGVSSALAAPAAAGIPVTLRGVAGAVTVVTGHDDPNGSVDWEALATSGATLVVLMGAGRAASVAGRLLAGGLDPGTPVACVTWATTPRQQVRRTTLAELGTLDLEPPTTIVIGEVAAHDVGAP